MVYAVTYDDEIRVWWDECRTQPNGERYRITVNGKNCIYTEEVYYDFKNLEAGCVYDFCIEVVDKNHCAVGKSQSAKYATLPHKSRIDVTNAPYFAIGDGETDNTANIQRAFDDCTEQKYVYFPMGIYRCGAIQMRGDIKIRFDAGVILTSDTKKW